MKELNKQPKVKIPRLAYAGFLFQTFFRRPFGYIIACLYVVYLSVILLIVPKVLHFDPLFIWNVGGFNMPVFNLFFIAASSAALAVSIFRTGREDGTELSLSSKPLTKGSMVAMKVMVYLIIMVAFCLIANLITLLIQPLYGWYDEISNIRGITPQQYLGINLSVLIGNLVNMVLFGGISVFITMVGGQVITMVGTIGIVFIMCLMNFLYPQIVTSSLEVLQNKYDAEMLSYSVNTLDQYENADSSGQKKFSTIACTTDAKGVEKNHFDTYEYWMKAERESGGKATNYIDFARQLSSLFNSFGLDDSKLKEASKLAIGVNRGYDYDVIPETHITLEENINDKKYPIAFYGMTTSQGFQYPLVIMLGGDMGVSKQNWLALSVLNQYDFDAASVLTNGTDSLLMCDDLIRDTYKVPFYKMHQLTPKGTSEERLVQLYNLMLDKVAANPMRYKLDPTNFSNDALELIESDDSGIWFEAGTYPTLDATEQHKIVSQIHMYWACYAQMRQKSLIKSFIGDKDNFPFKSSTILQWYKSKIENDPEYKTAEAQEYLFGNLIFQGTIQVRDLPEGSEVPLIKGYDKLVTCKLNYAETYSNLYQYQVKNFYSIKTIVIVWSIVAVMCFTGSVIVYKKTDFK